jgi:predicted nucleotidyltransferase component of viral defense system
VDLAQDARLTPAEPTPFGPILVPEELAADKMLTLSTRAEARDYVDVYFLARRFGTDRLLELAKEKDAGFDPSVFAEMLRAIGRLDREEFDVDDPTLDAVRAFIAQWRDELRPARG